MNVDILPAGTRQLVTLERRTSPHITWAPIIYTGVQSNDYLGTESIYGTIFNTSPAKTVRHETDERVCDIGAILSDQWRLWGHLMGRWEQGTGLAFSLSLFPSLCL